VGTGRPAPHHSFEESAPGAAESPVAEEERPLPAARFRLYLQPIGDFGPWRKPC
jgi:hypothetical protein